MENLEKALLLIGQMMLAIMIISLAVYIFNQVSSSQIYTVMDEQNVRAYNRSFNIYDGKNNISGSNLKTLFAKVIEHNEEYKDDNSMWINVKSLEEEEPFDENLIDNGVFVDTTVEDYNAGIYFIMKSLWTGNNFSVKCSYDPGNGRIVCIQCRKYKFGG